MKSFSRSLRRLDIKNPIDEALIGNAFKRQNKRLNRLLLLTCFIPVLSGFLAFYFKYELIGIMGLGISVMLAVIETFMGEQRLRYVLKRTVHTLKMEGYLWDIDAAQILEVMKPIWKYTYGR